MASDSLLPITVYGSDVSYFTGKLENYLRIKGLPYTLEAMQFPDAVKENIQRVGIHQMPVMQLGDGRWLTDTTRIIEWFELQCPENPVVPPDPVQAFLCLLIEDYADEWLWRPAMHYRWYYVEGAHHQSRHLVDEVMKGMRLPGPIKRAMLRRRQRGGYTAGDGITPEGVAGVEQIFLRTLAHLEGIFQQRAYLFGERPSLADIGLSGPFFRHFALDPIPLAIIRERAPAVLEWVARLWNSPPERYASGNWLQGVPGDMSDLLQDIGEHYLPYLNANIGAVRAGRKRFDATIGGVAYRGARYSRYRVWCLQALRNHVEALPEASRAELQVLLEAHGCWAPLWLEQELPLLPGQEENLPFRGDTKMIAAND